LAEGVGLRGWTQGLDSGVQARIQARVLRFEQGNLGDHKALADDLFEARFTFGAGYRIYFSKQDDRILLLLIGGDKKSQSADIRKAKAYLKDFISEEKGHAKKKL
jgi:putative addiction module killer protein